MSAGGNPRHGVFINVEVDESIAGDATVAAKLAEVCPVDIYANRDGRVQIVEENLDECVLCELCMRVAPQGTVKVIKLYDDGAVLGA